MLRIIKRIIGRCVVVLLLWLLKTELFWGRLFNMICWIICVVGIVVDNLGCCWIGMK